MSEQNDRDAPEERRSMPRYPSRAAALLYRVTDAMRIGISGRLTDVSVEGLGIQVEAEIEVREEVQIELSNPLQRFKKTVRGIVRHCTAEGQGGFRLGVELQSRLTPPEVQMLRSNRPEGASDDAPTWV